MDNPAKLTTLWTQSIRRTQTKHKAQHNMCWTPLYSNKHNTICAGHHYAQNKHNTICVRHHYTQTNTTQYVLDTTILKQTQHNMC